MINTHKPEPPLPHTHFHGSKDAQAVEPLLYPDRLLISIRRQKVSNQKMLRVLNIYNKHGTKYPADEIQPSNYILDAVHVYSAVSANQILRTHALPRSIPPVS